MKGIDDAVERYFRHEVLHTNMIPDYPVWAKRGTYMGRRAFDRVLTAEELGALPPLHAARKNPGMVVRRSEIQVLDLPQMAKITNRVQVLLGAPPTWVGMKNPVDDLLDDLVEYMRAENKDV